MDRARSRVALGALAAELGHDLQGPLNLFRMMADRVERGETLDQEDATLLREELERVAKLTARLRRLARPSAERRATSFADLLDLAVAKAGGPLSVEAGEANEHSVSCDTELVSLALAELLTNALHARAERAGVRFELGDSPSFCVWDDGPGFEPNFEQALQWGVSTHSSGAGLGLTLVLRAARAHGLTLEHRRLAGKTELRLMFPRSDVVASSTEVPTKLRPS